jgi:predicted CopG family antitoxin
MVRPDNKKSIEIFDHTYARLVHRKKVPRESFDSVINRILDGDKNGRTKKPKHKDGEDKDD